MTLNVCTWMYQDEERDTPDADWRCVAVFFASSVRNNPQASHILFTNASRLPRVGGVDLGRYLIEELKVRIERIPAAFVAPFGYLGMAKKPMFRFDALRRLAAMRHPEDAKFLLLDPASVWLRPASIALSQLDRYGLLTLDVSDALPAEGAPGGISLLRWRQICAEMDASAAAAPHQAAAGEAAADRSGAAAYPPAYYGAECFAATLPALRLAAAVLEDTWKLSVERFRRNRPKPPDEAYLLSYVYYRLGCVPHTANPFLRRILTAVRGSGNAREEDRYLTVWHLPRERGRGFDRLYRHAVRKRSAFWTAKPETYRRLLARTFGVPRRTGMPRLRDVRHLVYERLRGANK